MFSSLRDHRIDGLDGLRGIAALAVFGVHFGQNTGVEWFYGDFDLRRMLEHGELGVSLFFTLSGFLLALPYVRALRGERGWPAPGRYALRRAARILPLYYVSLAALVVAFGYWRAPGGWSDIALHATMLFNYAEFSIISLNKPYWTLAVEVQFYLLLPVVFVLLRRAGAAGLGRQLAWIAALAACAYGAHLAVLGAVDRMVAWPGQPHLLWLRPGGAVVSQSLLAHLPHFLIGVAAATVTAALAADPGRAARLRPGVAEAAVWGAAAVVAAHAATGLLDELAVPGGRYGLPTVPLLIGVIVFAVPRAPLARGLLESAPLRALGTVSYGIYVLHLPCQYLVAWQMQAHGLDTRAAWATFGGLSLALTLALAALSWRLIERPVLRWAHGRHN